AGRAPAGTGEFGHFPVGRELTDNAVGPATIHVAFTVHRYPFGPFEPSGRTRHLIEAQLLIRHDGSPFSSLLADSAGRATYPVIAPVWCSPHVSADISRLQPEAKNQEDL